MKNPRAKFKNLVCRNDAFFIHPLPNVITWTLPTGGQFREMVDIDGIVYKLPELHKIVRILGFIHVDNSCLCFNSPEIIAEINREFQTHNIPFKVLDYNPEGSLQESNRAGLEKHNREGLLRVTVLETDYFPLKLYVGGFGWLAWANCKGWAGA